MYEWFDSELVEVDDSGVILKTFKKPAKMSRAEYRFMCTEIELTQTDTGNSSWNNLSQNEREILEEKADMEFQNFHDIREGLLATLNEYKGFIDVKMLFSDAIRGVEFK